MVSDFIDEQNGYLQLTDKEFEHAKEKDPSIRKHTCQLLEYGKAREGYWMSKKKVTPQLKEAVKLISINHKVGTGLAGIAKKPWNSTCTYVYSQLINT